MIRKFLLITGCAGFLLVLAADIFYTGGSLVAENRPFLKPYYLMRSLAILISSYFLLKASIADKRGMRLISSENNYFNFVPVVLTLFFSVIFILIFLIDIRFFSRLSLEMGFLEVVQFLLLIGSAFIFMKTFRLSSRNSIYKSIKLLSLFFAFGFFLVAMEEISWFQSLLNYQTPELLSDNTQKEANLHNFATSYVENVYYFGAFLFLVLLPFLHLVYPERIKNKFLYLFIPQPYLIFTGAIAAAYNYDMWNIIFMQTAFWSSIAVLFIFFIFNPDLKEKYVLIFTIILMLVLQFFFIVYGNNMNRSWDITEYREFFIPLGFFFYSLDVYSGIKKEYFKE